MVVAGRDFVIDFLKLPIFAACTFSVIDFLHDKDNPLNALVNRDYVVYIVSVSEQKH